MGAKDRAYWEGKKAEILSRLDIRAEFEAMGVRMAGQRPSSTGWIPVHNPYKMDRNPSAGINVGSGTARGYLKVFNAEGKERSSDSLFDVAMDFHPTLSGYDFKTILKHYGEKTGVEVRGPREVTPPTLENVQEFRNALSTEVRRHLHEHRGLNNESIEKYEIGFRKRDERLTYPVYDSNGQLVNIRFHAWQKKTKPKTLNWRGTGQKRLWNAKRAKDAPDDSIICLTEGEWDSMLIEQEAGLVSVSPTNGTEAFDSQWVEFFHGKHAVLVWDCDTEGRDTVSKKIIPAFRTAIRQGKVKSIKIVWLFDDPKNKDKKDFTDFIVKAGGTGDALLEMIDKARAEDFPVPSTEHPDPVSLENFTEIENPEYLGKRVTCPIFIHGENSEAYHAPTRVFIGDCPGKKKGCHGRDDWAWSCDEPIPIKIGSPVQLSCVGQDILKMKKYIVDWLCDKNGKPVITVDAADRITIREFYAHQVLENSLNTESIIEKPIYAVGKDIYPVGQYQATGYVVTNPRNQKPTMYIDTMEAQEEDWQAFNLDQAREHLRRFEDIKLTNGKILEEMMNFVTQIYERYDLHLMTLLTLCSPRYIDMPGDGRIRGWVSSCVIGDSGTGKSTVAEKIIEYARVGNKISGMTASRTGITYAIDYDKVRGWRLRAGALVKMSGQVIIIDEAQDVAEEDLKTMADSLDRGRLKIDRVVTRELRAETRCLFICNPKHKIRTANQRTMGSFKYGCLSIQDIFPVMMIRRMDMFCFASNSDIKNKNKVFNQESPERESRVTPEMLRALIFYAWNLPSEKIIISEEIGKIIKKEAIRLSGMFGSCEDLLIVCPEDFRKTFCRLCVACAVIDLSSDDDFETIAVEHIHVDFMSMQLELIYNARNCQLDKYSNEYRQEHKLDDAESMAEMLRNHINTIGSMGRHERISFIFGELLRLDPSNHKEKLSQSYLVDYLDVSRKTISEDMKPLIQHRIVISSRGYVPTPKLFQLFHFLESAEEGSRYYKLLG